MRLFYVYILSSCSRTLYTGVTNNLERRMLEHLWPKAKSFSSRYKTYSLVHYEIFTQIRDAIAREKQIKGWVRIRKLKLIDAANPEWKDLAASLPRPARDSS